MNKDITKSRIKDMLEVYDKKTSARECEIGDVPREVSKEFQRKNHLQGAVNAKVHLGLYHEGELVALMTFGKCRFDKKHEWEMLRFCCRLGWHIPGAAGKLLKHFERTYRPKSLVSFKTRTNALLSRLNFQKHKLKDVLKNFDPAKSEYENMKANGYYRIYDCGNMVFEKTYPENEKAG